MVTEEAICLNDFGEAEALIHSLSLFIMDKFDYGFGTEEYDLINDWNSAWCWWGMIGQHSVSVDKLWY